MKRNIVRLALLAVLMVLLGTVSGSAVDSKKTLPAKTETTSVKPQETSTAPQTPASPATGEQINWQVISSGGGRGSSTSFILATTIGQTAVGFGGSTNYGLRHGFQQAFGGGGGCCDNRGDVDHSGGVDVGDLTYIVDYLFRGGPPPVCDESGYYAEADVDNSGGIDVGDLTYIVDYLFRGGPAPVPC